MANSLLVIHCAEGGRKALQRMTELGYRLPPEVRTFELPCTGRINEVMLMEALEDGAGGILVVGCRKDNCKYLDGSTRAERKVERVRGILQEAGVARKSVGMVTVAPDEGQRLYRSLMSARERLQETVEEGT